MYFSCLIPRRRHSLFKFLSYFNIIDHLDYLDDIVLNDDIALYRHIVENYDIPDKVIDNNLYYGVNCKSYSIVNYICIETNRLGKTDIESILGLIAALDDSKMFCLLYYNYHYPFKTTNIKKYIDKCIVLQSYNVIKAIRNTLYEYLEPDVQDFMDKRIILFSITSGKKDIGDFIIKKNPKFSDYKELMERIE